MGYYYKKFNHCGETFYTGLDVETLSCSECGESITGNGYIQTRVPISKQDYIEPVTSYENREQLPGEAFEVDSLTPNR